jgi:RNA polymerase sigma-70 factor (ECF subfamily)
VPCSAPDQFSGNDDLPQREVDIIGHVVRDFLSTRELHSDLELEDLVQECLLHWWVQKPKYRQSRGASIATFLRRVVNNKLFDLERGAKAQKRGQGRSSESLDQPLGEDEPEGDTLADYIADPANTEWEALHRVSLAAALSRLSPRQEQIINGLRDEYTVSQISRQLGVPRATLYDDLKRIRQIFRDEGLNQFLDESDS